MGELLGKMRHGMVLIEIQEKPLSSENKETGHFGTRGEAWAYVQIRKGWWSVTLVGCSSGVSTRIIIFGWQYVHKIKNSYLVIVFLVFCIKIFYVFFLDVISNRRNHCSIFCFPPPFFVDLEIYQVVSTENFRSLKIQLVLIGNSSLY